MGVKWSCRAKFVAGQHCYTPRLKEVLLHSPPATVFFMRFFFGRRRGPPFSEFWRIMKGVRIGKEEVEEQKTFFVFSGVEEEDAYI